MTPEHDPLPWALVLHTAISFTTNTSWQNYAGETTTGHLAVMAGLGVQAFASASVGICVALALTRALVRRGGTEVGSFWVDLFRSIFRVILPLALLSGVAGSRRLGWSLLAVILLFGALFAIGVLAQTADTGTVAQAVGRQVEGTEARFGVPASTLFGVAATASPDGAANASFESFSSVGGGVLMAAMMLGEIAPGGAGSGRSGLISRFAS